MTIGELKKILSKYPDNKNVIVTWESCLWEITEDNIYPAEWNDSGNRIKSYIIIDADDNHYKDFYQGRDELDITDPPQGGSGVPMK